MSDENGDDDREDRENGRQKPLLLTPDQPAPSPDPGKDSDEDEGRRKEGRRDEDRPETAADQAGPRQGSGYSLAGIGIGVGAQAQGAAPQQAKPPAPEPARVRDDQPRESRELVRTREAQTPAPPPPPSPPPPPRPIAAPDPGSWPVRGPLMVGLLAILILFGGFGLWAMESRIAGAVVAPGQVEVEQQRQVVQHPDGGVVEEIAVTDGQSVAAGDLLIRLDGSLVKTELTIVEGQYFEILARRGRLEAERAAAQEITFPRPLTEAAARDASLDDLIAGQRSLFEARRDTQAQSLDQLAKQSQQVAQQVEGIDAQIAAMGQQRDLIGQELKDQQSLLDRGLAQASRVLGLQREAARIDGQIGELKASRAASETKQTEIDVERLRMTAQRREDAETQLRDLGYRELELAERRRSLTEQISRLDIRAPVAGLIYDLKVTTPRSVIRPAEPLMYIIPQDRPLVIGARIATINVDEVMIGQPVVLRFSSFSSRTMPEIDGRLGRISADALVDEGTRTPYYRAEVTIPPEELEKLGDMALIPGMPVEVFIQTGERSPMAYLLKPLADYFNRAFRES